ncbi:hypothetical protein KR018_008542 [Drosophila ironensis]|nr:hypothetical protein KR018_008542 [Drosophila ironensis]
MFFLVDALTKAKEQQRENAKLQKQLRAHQEQLEKRLALEEELKRELESLRQYKSELRENHKQRKILASQYNNELMECIHTLKQATGTYINHDALPARVKGVTVLRSRAGEDDQWIPFDLSVSDSEGFDTLIETLESKQVDVNQWRQLVSLEMSMPAKLPSSPPKDAPDEGDIIEIDLTSPTAAPAPATAELG